LEDLFLGDFFPLFEDETEVSAFPEVLAA